MRGENRGMLLFDLIPPINLDSAIFRIKFSFFVEWIDIQHFGA